VNHVINDRLWSGPWVFAGLGELAACQRALDATEGVRELSGDASNGGWLRFDSSRLAEERGACYVQLQYPDLAEATLGDTVHRICPHVAVSAS
jgi:hypothetical protein